MPSTMTLSGTIPSLLSGNETIGPITQNCGTALQQAQPLSLILGNTSFTAPAGAVGVLLNFPTSGWTGVVTLRGIAADTGVSLLLTGQHFIAVTPGATFVLTSTANNTSPTGQITFL